MSPVGGWGGGGRTWNVRTGSWEFSDGFGNPILGSPAAYPRDVRRLLVDRSLAVAVLLSQSVMGYTPGELALIPGQRSIFTSGAPAPTLTTVGDGNNFARWRRMRRSGGGVKEAVFRDWGPHTMHHILDPTASGPSGWGIIVQDLLVPTFDAGNAWAFMGIGSFNTATTETSRVGCWWSIDSAGLKWKSGVYDGTATPSNTLHETAHSDLAVDATGAKKPHRLSIWIDAKAKNVKFYANGALVDTFTPGAALAQFSNSPQLLLYLITASGADASLYHWGGMNPRFLTLVPAA